MGEGKGDVPKRAFNKRLECMVKELYRYNVKSIGIVTILEDGAVGTQYYNASLQDMAIMENGIRSDIVLDIARVNAKMIVDAAKEEEDEEEE